MMRGWGFINFQKSKEIVVEHYHTVPTKVKTNFLEFEDLYNHNHAS